MSQATMSIDTSSGTGPHGQELPKSLFGYNVVDFIGEGAASLIYAVAHPESHQIYALKHVIRHDEKSIRFIEQLENEYNVGKHFSHPNLRRIVDMKVHKTLLLRITEAILVMELFDGSPLDQNLPQTTGAILECFIQTAKGLEAIHSAGYVHCDLKPNNILLNRDGQVKVIDFGQTCPVGTIKKRIQGTPDFISPEQVKLEPVSYRTDVFNFGATLYWAICGCKLPTLYTLKKGENSFIVDNVMRSPRDYNPKIPEVLSNFVMECVRNSPEKRPKDMAEVVRRLEVIHHVVTRHAQNIHKTGVA